MTLKISESNIEILSFFGNILNIIHLIVPILLIILVTIDLAKAVLSQDDEIISKTVRTIKNRVIAGLAIFFLPTIVEVLFNNVFVALNMDPNLYKEIMASYKQVIKSEEIKVEDESKNNEISNNLKYTLTNNEFSVSEDIKQKYLNYSKEITKKFNNYKKLNRYLETINIKDFIINYNKKSYKISDKITISYDKLLSSQVTDNSNYIIVSFNLSGGHINKSKDSSPLSLSYYYKKSGERYILERLDITSSKVIDIYSDKNINNEKEGVIASAERFISTNNNYDYSKLNALKEQDIKKIYNSNIKNIVFLSTITNNSAIVNKSIGFFIGNGLIATSWSYLANSFMNSQAIIISDNYKNTYKCSGVVAIDIQSDIVVLKLNKEVKRAVVFGDSKTLLKNDPVIAITSKTGVSFITATGIVSSSDNSIISVLPLSKNDWGSPLFNTNGEVIGINTSRLINSETSQASSIEGLKELQNKFKNIKFKDISVTSIEKLKQDYYYKDKNKEQIINSIPKKIWNNYKKIGDIENSIILDLVKANYYEGIVSLRYQNTTSKYINNLDYASEFISNLEKDGYIKVTDTNEKLMYKKGRIKVIIMDEFDYLIIVLVKESSI